MKALKMNWSVTGKCRSELFGIAILAVLCVHGNEFYWSPDLSIVVKILSQGSIGVDIFLFLSGMGLYYSLKKDENIVEFYKRRILRILPVYLLIAGVGYAIVIFLFGNGNVGEYLFKLSTLSFWVTGEGTVWYISFLLIMYMVYPAVYRLRKQSFAKHGFLLLAAGVLVLEACMIRLCPEVFLNIEAAITRIIVFLLGSYIAPWIDERRNIKPRIVILWIFVFVIMRTVRIFFISPENLYCNVFVRISNLFLTLDIVTVGAFIVDCGPKWIKRFLSWFGEKSLEIYLVHAFAINVFYSLPLSKRGNYAWIYFLVLLPVSVLIAAGIYCVKMRIKKNH
ncbi:MAG: acyltransferase [Lachnospiraceae bacterium]|nr:acyltransferase [Lachnospiraceae bacterium]